MGPGDPCMVEQVYILTCVNNNLTVAGTCLGMSTAKCLSQMSLTKSKRNRDDLCVGGLVIRQHFMLWWPGYRTWKMCNGLLS